MLNGTPSMVKRSSHNLPSAIRVVLVEDRPDLRRGLSSLLNEEDGYECVGSYNSIEQVVSKIRASLETETAISAVLLWAITLTHGWKRIPKPPQPSPHSGRHKLLGWLSTISLTLTSVTGLVFYYYAFMI